MHCQTLYRLKIKISAVIEADMKPKVYKVLAFVFALSYIIALFCVVFLRLSFKDALGSDFVSFLTGAEILKNGEGEKIYSLDTQYEFKQKIISPEQGFGILPFRNLPAFALLFIPFTFFNTLLAYRLFVTSLIIIAVYLAFTISRLIKKYPLFSIWSLLPLVYYPSLGSIFIGQVTVIFILIFLLIYRNIKSKNFFIAGVFTGLLLLKLQYFLAFPYLLILVEKKREFLKGSLLSIGIIILLSIYFSGITSLMIYPSYLLQTETPNLGSRLEHIFTLYALFKHTLPTKLDVGYLVLINFIFYFVSLGIFAKIVKKNGMEVAFVLLSVFTIIFSVHSIDYDVGLLIVPVIILASTSYRRKLLRFRISTIVLILLAPLITLLGYGFLVPIYLAIVSVTLLIGQKI